MKKAYELSVLCDCEIAIVIIDKSEKVYRYGSSDFDKIITKYAESNEPYEIKTNADIIEVVLFEYS